MNIVTDKRINAFLIVSFINIFTYALFLGQNLLYHNNMSPSELLDLITDLLTKVPFNIFDTILILVFALYVFEEKEFGFASAITNLLTNILSFFIALFFYSKLSSILINFFSFDKGFADASSFLIITVPLWITLKIVLDGLRKTMPDVLVDKKIDQLIAAIFGSISFFFLSLFIVVIAISFPISMYIKNNVLDSYFGNILLVKSYNIESNLKELIEGKADNLLNILILGDTEGEKEKLLFAAEKISIDNKSKDLIFGKINKERFDRGLYELAFDGQLALVAEKHGKDMAKNRYLSHKTLDGFDLFDRLENANVIFTYARENIALVQDESLMMEGLVNNINYKKSVFQKDFRRVGIAVVDVESYGKIVVVIFID